MLSHAQIGGFVAMLDLRWPGPLRWFFEVETAASRYVRWYGCALAVRQPSSTLPRTSRRLLLCSSPSETLFSPDCLLQGRFRHSNFFSLQGTGSCCTCAVLSRMVVGRASHVVCARAATTPVFVAVFPAVLILIFTSFW